MATTAPSLTTTAAAASSEAKANRVPRRFPPVLLYLAVFWITLVVLMAVFADWLPFIKHDPINDRTAAISRMKPFHAKAWFGGDQNGRDIFSYTVYGARASLLIGLATSFFGILFGGFFGLLAGYLKGKWDTVISGVADMLLAFPALILLIGITSFWGREVYKIVIALTLLSLAPLTRLVRANTLVYAEREFVQAARALGAKPGRIVFREILPNVLPVMLSFSFLAIAIIIVIEGTLSFLGVGLKANIPSWGTMITQGRVDLRRNPHIVMMPSLVLVTTVLSLNVIGERLRGKFDVRDAAV